MITITVKDGLKPVAEIDFRPHQRRASPVGAILLEAQEFINRKFRELASPPEPLKELSVEDKDETHTPVGSVKVAETEIVTQPVAPAPAPAPVEESGPVGAGSEEKKDLSAEVTKDEEAKEETKKIEPAKTPSTAKQAKVEPPAK
jgi:hypothetical protein